MSASAVVPAVVSVPESASGPLPLADMPYVVWVPDDRPYPTSPGQSYDDIGALEIVLTPRLQGSGQVPAVRLLIGPGDVLPIDGRLWASIYYTNLTPSLQGSAPHVTVQYLSSSSPGLAPLIAPADFLGLPPPRRTKRIGMAAFVNTVLSANANYTDALQVPSGQRWRIHSVGSYAVLAANAAGSRVTVSLQRLAAQFPYAAAIIDTGIITSGATSTEFSDEISNSVVVGTQLLPGDELLVHVDALSGDTIQIEIVLTMESDS